MATHIEIKPEDKAIDNYYGRLKDLKQGLKLKSEGNTRRAFSALLEETANARKWTLAEEVTDTRKGTRIRLDGVLYDMASTLPRGYWEAKDKDDDLNAEIISKRAKNYPINNIIFEDTERAVLIQDGVLMENIALDNRADLARLLSKFYNHTIEPFEKLQEALDYFSKVIPDMGRQLKEKIDASHKTNKKFQTEFADFMELCRTSLNPNISKEAVDEMLIQHLLTERLIRNIFQSDFVQRNVIAAKVEDVIKALTLPLFDRNEFQVQLDPFYQAIEDAANTLSESYQDKQRFINHVYEQFFQGYSVKVADTHGIVYTPQEIVDFMCAAVEEVLQKEFGKTLGQDGVTVLDPATGTGNFIINLLNRVEPRYRRDFYAKHLFANEVMLMPYYIAALNIEHAYYELEGQYAPFEGLCFVDTLDLAKRKQLAFSFMTEKNTERVQRQQDADITVIIGNPPYNVGQLNENDNNKNRKYEVIDERIKETYAKDSKATLNNKLYDAYVKFFRWATDRIGNDEGVVCFVTNNSFVDQKSFDGMRKHLLQDFTQVYHLDLHGDVRANTKLSGTSHNVFGIQTGVGITVAVRSSKHREHKLFYHRVPEFWRKEEKLGYLSWNVTEDGLKNALNTVAWEKLEPNLANVWITSDSDADYSLGIRLGDKSTKGKKDSETIFGTYSLGVSSNRDNVVYDFDKDVLTERVTSFIDNYNREVDRYRRTPNSDKNLDNFVDYSEIKWSRNLKRQLSQHNYFEFSESNLRTAVYRPFTRKYLYFERGTIDEIGQMPRFFPNLVSESENKVICTVTERQIEFSAQITNVIPALHYGGRQIQAFPFYVYDEDGSNRRENITDWALAAFREQYGDESISKWDIFYYVYGLLHHPAYRERYADNLKRELPRIPFVPRNALTLNPSPWGRGTLMNSASDSLSTFGREGQGERADESASDSLSTFGREGQGERADAQGRGTSLPLRPSGEGGWGDEGNQGEGNYRKAYVSEVMIKIARDLRQRETSAEDILWEALRNRRLANAKFRRQHPIEKTTYVVDFYCHEARLIVELDGGIHEQQKSEDAQRQADIEALNYRVLRFPNEDVYSNLEQVLEQIVLALMPSSSEAGKGAKQVATGSQEQSVDSPLPPSEGKGQAVNSPLPRSESGEGQGEGGFWAFSRIGKNLAEMHLNYESQPRYELQWEMAKGAADYRVEKMRPKNRGKVKLEALTLNPSPEGRGTSRPLRPMGDEGDNEGDYRKAYVSEVMIKIARDLRQRETPAEDILWEALRNRRLANLKFRRQHPIEKTTYVVDFYCHEARLIVELDGGIHEKQKSEDAQRQAEIEALGYKILRFPNEAIYDMLENVLETILITINKINSPLPRNESGEGLGVRAEQADENGAEVTVFEELEYNRSLTLKGIPQAAFAYRLGNRSALEWIIDQYQVKTDSRSGIVSDPNGYSDDEQYIVKLLEQVIWISVETVKLVNELKALEFREGE